MSVKPVKKKKKKNMLVKIIEEEIISIKMGTKKETDKKTSIRTK